MKSWNEKLICRKDGIPCTKSGLSVKHKLLHAPNPNWLNTGSLKDIDFVSCQNGMEMLYKDISKANNYLIRTFNQLDKYAKNFEVNKFEKLCIILSKHSKAMRTLSIQHVAPDWEQWTLHRFSRMMKDIDRTIRNKSGNIKITTMDLPKGDGTFRYLTIPTLKWRIVSRFWYILTEIWILRRNFIQPNQFGSLSERGAMHCWNQVWDKVKDAKFIFEIDIAQCFNSISWVKALHALQLNTTPRLLADWIIKTMIKSFWKIKKYKTVQDEKTRLEKIYKDFNDWNYLKWSIMDPSKFKTCWETLKIKHINRAENYQWLEEIEELEQSLPWEEPWPTRNIKHKEIWRGWWPAYAFHKEHLQRKAKGIPQGWSLSPMLCNLVLSIIAAQTKGVFYLDDGILYGDNEDECDPIRFEYLLEKHDLQLNWTKSGWIKRNNEWLKPLKFLGATLHPDGTWQSSTKKGGSVKLEGPIMKFYNPENNTKYRKLDLQTIVRNFGSTKMLSYLYNNGYKHTEKGKIKIMEKEFWKSLSKRYNLNAQNTEWRKQ